MTVTFFDRSRHSTPLLSVKGAFRREHKRQHRGARKKYWRIGKVVYVVATSSSVTRQVVPDMSPLAVSGEVAHRVRATEQRWHQGTDGTVALATYCLTAVSACARLLWPSTGQGPLFIGPGRTDVEWDSFELPACIGVLQVNWLGEISPTDVEVCLPAAPLTPSVHDAGSQEEDVQPARDDRGCSFRTTSSQPVSTLAWIAPLVLGMAYRRRRAGKRRASR